MYIGCAAWTVDDLHEETGVSKEVIRNFVHTFLNNGATVSYSSDQYVITPPCSKEAKSTWVSIALLVFLATSDLRMHPHVVLEREMGGWR